MDLNKKREVMEQKKIKYVCVDCGKSKNFSIIEKVEKIKDYNFKQNRPYQNRPYNFYDEIIKKINEMIEKINELDEARGRIE